MLSAALRRGSSITSSASAVSAAARVARAGRAPAWRRSSSSARPPEEDLVDWPILAGGALAVGLLLSGMAIKRRGFLARVQSNLNIGAGNLISDVSVRQLIGLTMAFTITQLPVEDVKVKLLAAGGLQGWGALLGCFELDQQQIALSALTALLEGDAPLKAFHAQSSWYDQLAQALPPLLHDGSGSLSDPEILLDALWLSTALVTHPIYLHSPGDAPAGPLSRLPRPAAAVGAPLPSDKIELKLDAAN